MLELKGVSKRYGEVEALKGVDLTVEQGETLSIVGPNGAGKTTLLKIMALLERPTSGRVLVDGVEAEGWRLEEMRRRITMVFQRPLLFRGSVTDNVAYGLRLRGIEGEEAEERVSRALELVGLEEMRWREARTLSYGEKRRVNIAMALALNCEVLLLDEPTANLDPDNTERVVKAIKGLRGKTTIVVATPNPYVAMEISNLSALLIGGEIIRLCKPRELKTL
jgi:tungstate transport system ATP-binding protein